MRKIVIIGSGGAGKSTLAQKLGAMLQIPIYHLDSIHWQPGWQPMERETFIKAQHEILKQETWIIDGNYGSTLDIRLQEADAVIFLHYRTIRCLYGIIKRRVQYRNKTRPDMGQDCPEKIDWKFIRWVRQFNKVKAPAIYQRLNDLGDTKILVFKTPKELKQFLTRVNPPI